jgi:quercetin dioxygenase-like cupin family protein
MVTRNYTDKEGRSCVEDLTLPFVWEEGRERTPIQSATGIRFNRWPAGRFRDWHNAPVRQYVIILSGQVDVGLEDGTVHRLGPGDVSLEEDLTGQGHTSRVVGDQPLLFVTVPLGG